MKLWQFYVHRKQLISVFFQKENGENGAIIFIFELRNRSRKTQECCFIHRKITF